MKRLFTFAFSFLLAAGLFATAAPASAGVGGAAIEEVSRTDSSVTFRISASYNDDISLDFESGVGVESPGNYEVRLNVTCGVPRADGQVLAESGEQLFTVNNPNQGVNKLEVDVASRGCTGDRDITFYSNIFERDYFFSFGDAGVTHYDISFPGVTGNKGTYQPGEQVTLDVKLVDQNGNPAQPIGGLYVEYDVRGQHSGELRHRGLRAVADEPYWKASFTAPFVAEPYTVSFHVACERNSDCSQKVTLLQPYQQKETIKVIPLNPTNVPDAKFLVTSSATNEYYSNEKGEYTVKAILADGRTPAGPAHNFYVSQRTYRATNLSTPLPYTSHEYHLGTFGGDNWTVPFKSPNEGGDFVVRFSLNYCLSKANCTTVDTSDTKIRVKKKTGSQGNTSVRVPIGLSPDRDHIHTYAGNALPLLRVKSYEKNTGNRAVNSNWRMKYKFIGVDSTYGAFSGYTTQGVSMDEYYWKLSGLQAPERAGEYVLYMTQYCKNPSYCGNSEASFKLPVTVKAHAYDGGVAEEPEETEADFENERDVSENELADLSIGVNRIRYVKARSRRSGREVKRYIVYVTVKNIGDTDVTERVRLGYAAYPKRMRTRTFARKGIAAGKSITKRVYLRKDARDKIYAFSVDPKNLIKESSVHNNSTTLTIRAFGRRGA